MDVHNDTYVIEYHDATVMILSIAYGNSVLALTVNTFFCSFSAQRSERGSARGTVSPRVIIVPLGMFYYEKPPRPPSDRSLKSVN
jgi:hypothetical protein